MSDRISPFAKNSQYVDWCTFNCERCAKAAEEEVDIVTCEIEEKLVEATWDNGTVSVEIAERMGHTSSHKDGMQPYVWPCGEVELIEEADDE